MPRVVTTTRALVTYSQGNPMNTITGRTAHADQLHAEVRDARSYDGHAAECDALDPCTGCKAKVREVRLARRSREEAYGPRAPPALRAGPTPRPGRPVTAPSAEGRPVHYWIVSPEGGPFLSRILCDASASDGDRRDGRMSSSWNVVTCRRCLALGSEAADALMALPAPALIALGAWHEAMGDEPWTDRR
jgi:hypothetical protein